MVKASSARRSVGVSKMINWSEQDQVLHFFLFLFCFDLNFSELVGYFGGIFSVGAVKLRFSMLV